MSQKTSTRISMKQVQVMLWWNLAKKREAKNIVKTLGCSHLRIRIFLALRAYIS